MREELTLEQTLHGLQLMGGLGHGPECQCLHLGSSFTSLGSTVLMIESSQRCPRVLSDVERLRMRSLMHGRVRNR